MLRYSSKQTTIELTPAERAAVDQVRVRAYPRPTPRNCATARPQAAGYEQVAGDAATDIVTGERHQKLVGRSRAARPARRRAITAPSRTTRAPTPSSSSAATAPRRVWIGLNSTIWDSNGDAKSRVVTDAAAYQDLFARLDQALKTPPARSPGKPQLPAAAVYHRIHPRSARPCQTSSQPGPRMRRRPVLSSREL